MFKTTILRKSKFWSKIDENHPKTAQKTPKWPKYGILPLFHTVHLSQLSVLIPVHPTHLWTDFRFATQIRFWEPSKTSLYKPRNGVGTLYSYLMAWEVFQATEHGFITDVFPDSIGRSVCFHFGSGMVPRAGHGVGRIVDVVPLPGRLDDCLLGRHF